MYAIRSYYAHLYHVGVPELLFDDTVRTEAAQFFGVCVTVGHDGAAFTRGYRLDGMETEDAHIGETADFFAVHTAAERMGGVVDHQKSMTRGNGVDGLKCHRISRKIDRYDRNNFV